jgi:nitroreductase
MELLDAIYHRRSVRHFSDANVPGAVIHDLLRAAIQAPSAVNQQPWAFAVVRGRPRLDDFSERAKTHMLAILPQSIVLHQRADTLASTEYHVFHHASTLVTICAKPAPHHPLEECCLAAQNFMLAAHGFGLGSCPVGFVRPWLNLPEIKSELGIPSSYTVVMPLVLGYPAGSALAPMRREPEIVCWLPAPEDKYGAGS